ncbi:NVEALA domain-containing protein [uncultured Bacteroides sp.]|uniref:NVEALA domain-containing protein n=1 Tax=uncultured Bacteroides sp. TaxID=162156 RepID=UPI0023C4CDB2|nr:NVEALA domain-containing protein [uncultured Bacteroides sp.]MDE6172723.1 NVEALA domain-containing protein [Bacteroides sp.]
MRIRKILFVAIIAMTASMLFVSSYKKDSNVDLLLKNVEACANSEHGEIDETLAPYRRLSSKTIYFILDGQIVSTRVPCCMSDPSKYSGCSNGLDGC